MIYKQISTHPTIKKRKRNWILIWSLANLPKLIIEGKYESYFQTRRYCKVKPTQL